MIGRRRRDCSSGNFLVGAEEGAGINHPVAVVEAVEIARVVAVAEVREDGDVERGGGLAEATGNSPPAVSVLPGGLGAELQFLDA